MDWRRWAKVYAKAVLAGSLVVLLPTLIIGVPVALVSLTQTNGEPYLIGMIAFYLVGSLVIVVAPIACAAALLGAPCTFVLSRLGQMTPQNFAVAGAVSGAMLIFIGFWPDLNAAVIGLAGMGLFVGAVTGWTWGREVLTPAASRSTPR